MRPLLRHEVALLVRNKKLVWTHVATVVLAFGMLATQVRVAQVRLFAAPMVLFNFLALLMFPTAVAPITIGVHLFVGEKERRTIEPLLLLPVSLRMLFGAKLALVLAAAFGELALFFLGGIAILKALGPPSLYPLIVNSTTLYVVGVLMPLLAMLLAFMATIVSARATSTQGATQAMGFVILPFMFLLTAVGINGLTEITRPSLASATVVFVILNAAACTIALRLLRPEILIRKRGQ